MSESIWCDIFVRIPTSWDAQTYEEGGEPAALGGGIAEYPKPIRLLADALGKGYVDQDGDDPTVWDIHGEGNYGLTDEDVTEALDWCERHAVPFVATDDGKYEIGGEFRAFDGREYVASDLAHTEAFGVVMPLATFEGIVNRESTGDPVDDDRAVIAAIRAYFAQGQPTIGQFSIDHLPEHEPTDEQVTT